MNRRVRSLLALTTLSAFALAACGDDASQSSPSTSAATAAPATTAAAAGCTTERVGGTVAMGMFTETTGLDPIVASGKGVAGAIEMAALYDTLMSYDTATGKYEPRVAQSLTSNTDFTIWTLKLRDGIKFGNGDPLTADAVKTSIGRHTAPTSRSTSRSLASNIAKMDVIDTTTLQFTLTSAWAGFPYLLGEKVGMITNQRVIDQLGAETFNLAPKGAGVGPFEYAKFAPKEEIILESKKDYWGGTVCLDRLRFLRITGAGPTYDALKANTLQVAFLREPAAIAQARKDQYETFVNLQNAGGSLIVNNGVRGGTPPTTDVRVRQAVAYAIDVEQLDERSNAGTGLPTSAIISDKSPFFQNLDGPQTDTAKARDLVQSVIAEGKWDGSIRLACQDSPAAKDRALAIEASLKAVGFKVTTELAPSVISKVVTDANFDLACWGFNIGDAMPWAAMDQFVSTSANNRTGYKDPQMDAAVAELKVAATAATQKAALAKIQEVWNRTVPSVVYETIEEVITWDKKVNGLVFTQDSVVYFSDAWLTK
ncbi:MAG TPA: ABC transporter substrate-binding protein [Acidimicrobiales bacterium]|nr:ABC transporter substrate-binding protein [Acidimicrobiales bacterium]